MRTITEYFPFRTIRAGAVVLVVLAASSAFAAQIFVAGSDPKADDKNPGTEARPFKTIQAALDKAQPGDSVQARTGTYHESLKFKHSGNPGRAAWNDPASAHWITLEAYKDDHVVLDGSLTIPAEDWKLVEGRTNTYVAPFECKAHIRQPSHMVFANDTLFMPSLVAHNDKSQPGLPMVPAMPGDKTSDLGWYHDMTRNKLFVNLGGRVPGKDLAVAAAQLDMGVDITYQSYVRLKGIEIRRFNDRGIWSDCSRDFMLEDNFIHHCQSGLWSGLSSGGIIRGNTFSDIMVIAMNVGDSRGTIIEGNLIKRFRVNPFKINSVYIYSAAIMCSASFGLAAHNNIITEGDVAGIWPDCGSIGIALYGNTIYGIPGAFYIEADVHGTVLQWNAVFDNGNGIEFRQNTANTALENYVFNNRGIGLTIGSCDALGIRADTMMYNWVVGNGAGAGFGPDSLKTPAHAFDHNVYCRNGILFQFGGKQYKDIQNVRDNVGVEMHGEEVKDFDPTPLGLVTFRVHDTKKSWKPVPMFGNPVAVRNDVQDDFELYFWKKGTFLRPQPYGWRGFGRLFGWTRGEANGFLRQLPVSVIPFAQNDPELKNKVNSSVDDPSACWTNGLCLQVCAIPGKSLSAEGLGYWSPNLPTTDEAQIDLSLWIRAKGIKPVGENGGVYAVAEFCDETGQNIKRQYLVGANDGRKVVGEKWTQGTYEYQKVSGTVTAPKGARWFKMAFGIRNCSGWAAFNNFDIHTRPGHN